MKALNFESKYMPQLPLMQVTPEGYPVPTDSADIYRRFAYFSSVYGDDYFFAVGYAEPPVKNSANFSSTEDVTLTLSRKVAWNARPPQTQDPVIAAARESFSKWREEHA